MNPFEFRTTVKVQNIFVNVDRYIVRMRQVGKPIGAIVLLAEDRRTLEAAQVDPDASPDFYRYQGYPIRWVSS